MCAIASCSESMSSVCDDSKKTCMQRGEPDRNGLGASTTHQKPCHNYHVQDATSTFHTARTTWSRMIQAMGAQHVKGHERQHGQHVLAALLSPA